MDTKLNANNVALCKNHKVTTRRQIAMYLWEAITKRLNEEAMHPIHLLAFFDPMDAGTGMASWLRTGPIVTKREIKMVHESVREWALALLQPNEARDPIRMHITTLGHLICT